MAEQPDIRACARRLHRLCEDRYPQAARLRAEDAFAALNAVPDLTVQHRSAGAGDRSCPVDGRYWTDGGEHFIEIYPRNDARDRFTAMHEFGHLLITYDEVWQYDVRPTLGKRHRYFEESIVNAFAAESLIPDGHVQQHLGAAVTARGLRDLYLTTQASAHACAVRSLSLPGDRCVMLTDENGTTLFTDSTGEPYAPGKGVPQPAIARAIENAQLDDDGQATLTGAEGIVYRSGKANPRVRFDVALSGGLVIVVATPTGFDSRIASDDEEVLLTCGTCDDEFPPGRAAGLCDTCREPKCPRCRACACSSQPAVCQRCFITLPVADMLAGRDRHDDC